MYGLAAVYIFAFATLIYNDLNGPEPLGFVADYSQGSPRVVTLSPFSAAREAGFLPGDRIRKVDNQAVENHADWLAVRTNLEVGRPVRVEVERGAERVELVLKLRRESREIQHRMLYLLARSSGVILLLLAFLIAFNRPYWLDARIGALLLAGMAVSSPDPPLGLAALWRQLPAPLTILLWIAAVISQCSLAPLLFTFFAIFPRRLLHSRRAWLIAWVPIMLAVPAMLPYFYAMVFRPQSATGMAPGWLLPAVVMILVGYVVAALAALVLNYRRLSDPNERRRVRVLVAGTMVGWIALMPGLIINYLPSAARLKVVYVTTPLSAIPFVLFTLFPLSFAYAILRHRVLDVRLLIRQGLQYAFARRILLSVVPALIVVLLVDLLFHGDEPLKAILVARGWIYGALGVLAVVAHRRRQDWLAALDRRFFRERYNAQQLLGDPRRCQSRPGCAAPGVADRECSAPGICGVDDAAGRGSALFSPRGLPGRTGSAPSCGRQQVDRVVGTARQTAGDLVAGVQLAAQTIAGGRNDGLAGIAHRPSGSDCDAHRAIAGFACARAQALRGTVQQ